MWSSFWGPVYYSFSHLTLHEYFTAQYIVNNEGAVKNLLSEKYVTDDSWNEVYLLTASLLDNADDFFERFQETIDDLITDDDELVAFIQRVKWKSDSVDADYKPAAVRAFYLSLAIDRASAIAFTNKLGLYDLETALSELTIPDENASAEEWKKLAENLRKIMVAHRDIGHQWDFSKKQFDNLNAYLKATCLLVDCLKISTVSNRDEIEGRILLPPEPKGESAQDSIE
ncbi:MAG: hypothetical protein AAF702_19915 [Chloroflexota bacterium]